MHRSIKKTNVYNYSKLSRSSNQSRKNKGNLSCENVGNREGGRDGR